MTDTASTGRLRPIATNSAPVSNGVASIDRFHLRSLERAFRALVQIYENGFFVTPGRKSHRLRCTERRAPSSDLRLLIDRNAQALREILVTGRKDWAEGKVEAVIAFTSTKGDISRLAAIKMRDRRQLGEPLLVDPAKPETADHFKLFLKDCDTLLTGALQQHERAALGALLAVHAVGRGRLEIVEMKPFERQDYRDFLAGSAWIDMNLDLSSEDLFGIALLTSMQVRSLRKSSLQPYKQGYYTAHAVQYLEEQGLTKEAIADRLKIAEDLVQRWMGKAKRPTGKTARSAAGADDDKRPSTRRQLERITLLTDRLPFLATLVTKKTRKSLQAASAFIGLGNDLLGIHDAAVARFKSEIVLRRALGDGLPMAKAAALSELSPREASELLGAGLERSRQDLLAALEERLGNKIPANLYSVEMKEVLAG